MCTERDLNICVLLKFLNTDYSVLITNFCKLRSKIEIFESISIVLQSYCKNHEISLLDIHILLNDENYEEILKTYRSSLQSV